jgi:hypothetical protein
LLGLPYLQPDHYHIPGEVLTILPQPLQKRLCTFPLAYEIKSAEERLYVAIIPSMSEEQLPYLAELLDMCIKPVAASCTAIRRMIDRDVSGMKLGQEQPLLELAHLQLPASIFSAAREFNPPVQGHLAA